MAPPRRNKFGLVIFLLSILGHTAGAQEIQYGSLYQLITQIKNAMPGQNSYGFVVPTLDQMNTFRSAVDHVLSGDYPQADSISRLLGYGLYEWYDTSQDSALFYVVKEPTSHLPGGVALGWGTFIFDPDGERQAIIEVPHPLFDSNTWQVGFVSYQVIRSAFFLMAGTHRYANGTNPRPADVAHNTQNMFHVVHQAVSPLCQHSLQIHGFSRSNHPGYPDVILSNGTPNPSQILDSLATQIIAEGYTVGIFDGVNWSNLGATTNTQGQFSNANGYSFIHMELEYFIRSTSSHWERFVDILYRTFYLPLMGWPLRDVSPLATDFLLFPTYPNPFNSCAVISYQLPEAGRVVLEIYDILGRRIRILRDEFQTAGSWKTSWDGRDAAGDEVASGPYLLRAGTGKTRQYQRMMYIK